MDYFCEIVDIYWQSQALRKHRSPVTIVTTLKKNEIRSSFQKYMGATYYIQICPTCGRRLEIKIEYIGLEVSCYHCRARFTAENSHENYSPFPSMVQKNINSMNSLSYFVQYSGEGTV